MADRLAALGADAAAYFDDEAVPKLAEYVGLRCLSPAFDPEWERHGEIDRAAELLADFARTRKLGGLTVEVVRRPGLTPAIVAEVPATAKDRSGVTLLYGHLDKQPPLGTWREGLDPFVAVREGDGLYGRGVADDGYALFSALGALELLERHGVGHGRCVVLIEASEESGSPHLDPYLAHVSALVGHPGPALVVCLDSGAATYDRLWTTSSLRGNLVLTLTVEVLTAGVHSGSAGGIVPSSFRIARRLLSRLEDADDGRILVPECRVEVAERHRRAAEQMAADLGDDAAGAFPLVEGLELPGTAAERLLAHTFEPALAITGADGLPSVADGGNVLRPCTTLKLSLRLPPGVDAEAAGAAVVAVLEADPPYGAEVRAVVHESAPGFESPPEAPWLEAATNEASVALFGRPAAAMGEGGTIPFLAVLAARFPAAQFLVTGVLGPGSNAHGPNERLDVPTAARVTAAVAHVLASAP